jgi:hypothetical protein
LIWLWWGRSQTRRSLSALRHDPAEEVARAMADGGGRLGGASMLRGSANARGARVTTARLELAMETLDLLVVSMTVSVEERVRDMERCYFCFKAKCVCSIV